MRNFRIVLWVAVFVMGGFLAWNTLDWTMRGGNSNLSQSVGSDIGGPFEALRSDGKSISQDDMIGRPHLVFFGFTHCPDVCPTTLYEASQWLEKLGSDADRLDIYFVSIDPQRDTVDALAEYLSAFDERIIGITGTTQQIDTMVKAWRVYAQRQEIEGDYTMNHTATTFLMDAKGKFFGTISYGEDGDVAVSKLKRLLKAG